MKGTLIIVSTLILSSCALDKIFLHPYPLDNSSSFSSFIEEYDDTLTMTFNDDHSPKVHNSVNEVVEFPYEWESVFFKKAIGDSLNGWLFTPKNYNGSTIYFLHGNAAHLVYQYGLATPFVKEGYQVFMIDYSGFGFSTGKATRKNVLRDGLDGLDYLFSREDLEWEELIIYGQSLGGHLATVVAEQNQDRIDGLVIEGAFSSHSDIASDQVPVLGRIFTREMYSAKKVIGQIEKPVLVIHSTEDATVGYENGLRLYEKATSPKKMLTIDNLHIRGPLFHLDTIISSMEQVITKKAP